MLRKNSEALCAMQETQKPNKEIEQSRKRGQHPWSSCHHCKGKEIRQYWIANRTICRCNIPQLEVLAALQGELLLGLASSALETQDDLLGGLGLLVEDGLGLTTVTTLLPVVTALTLGEEGGLNRKENIISNCSRLPSRCRGH